MKKFAVLRLVVIAIVIIIAASICLTACDDSNSLIRPNEERTTKQATAVVNYGGRQAMIDKVSLLNSFYSYYNTLYQYYQYGYITATQFQSVTDNLSKTFEDANESLAKTSLFQLYCIDYMEKTMGRTNSASTVGKTYDFEKVADYEQYIVDRIAELESLFTVEELNEAILAANETLKDQFDSYYEEIKEDREAASEEDEEEEEVLVPSTNYIKSVEVTTLPRTLIYEVGDTLDLTGMVLTVNYERTFANQAAVDEFFNDETNQKIYTKGTTTNGAGDTVKVIYTATIDDYVTVNNTFETPKEVTSITDATATDAYQINVYYGVKVASFDVMILAARPDRATEAEEEEEEEEEIAADDPSFANMLEVSYSEDGKAQLLSKFRFVTVNRGETEQAEYKIRKEAMAKLEANLTDNYVSYDYYYLQQLLTVLTNTCKEHMTATTVSIEDINEQFEVQVNKDKETYSTEKSFIDAIEKSYASMTVSYKLGTDNGAFFIKHILFPFSTEQSDAITALTDEKGSTTEQIEAYREQLATEIKVWLTNPDYVTGKECEDENCTCPLCENYSLKEGDEGYLALADLVAQAVADKTYLTCPNGLDCTCVACSGKEYTDLNGDIMTAPISVYDLIGEYQSDVLVGGAIGTSLDAIVRSDYTTEEEYRLAVIAEFDKWIKIADIADKSGMQSVLDDNLIGNIGYPEGYDSSYVTSFTALIRDLATKGFGSYGYCVSEYGIHFVMITGYASEGVGTSTDTMVVLPVDYVADLNNYNDGTRTYVEKDTLATKADSSLYTRVDGTYVINGDTDDIKVYYDAEEDKYYYESTAYKVVDANGNFDHYAKAGTFEKTIYETVLNNKQTEIYSKIQKDVYDQYLEDSVKYNADAYKDTIKTIDEQVNG